MYTKKSKRGISRRQLFLQALMKFKKAENVEGVLLLAGDKKLVAIALSWKMLNVTMKTRLSVLNFDESQRDEWSWLWENTVYSISELAMSCGFKEEVVADKLHVLIANRMVYPDGTLNSILEQYLRQKVADLFKLRRGSSVSSGLKIEGGDSSEN